MKEIYEEGIQKYYEAEYLNPDQVVVKKISTKTEGNLAVCIPTYNRPGVVQELLEKELNKYNNYGWDLYIYDSSELNATQRIVARYTKKYSNLFYYRFPSRLHSNMKVYKIFQKHGFIKKYKYMWICNDAIRWNDKVLDRIHREMNNNYDIIVPNFRDFEELGDVIYNDKLLFFKDCSWHLTLYGAAVLKVSTLLENVNWQYLTKKYNVPLRVNFSHLCFYFEKLSKMQNFSAIHLSYNGGLTSSSKKQYPGWRNNTFFVFGYCFPDAIRALPKEYNVYKSVVIKKHGILGDVFNERNLLALRIDNLYNEDIYKEFLYKWKYITELPIKRLKEIVEDPVKAAFKAPEVILFKKQIKKLISFLKKYSQIYIYGAGKCAYRYYTYLQQMNYKVKGYIVSNKKNNLDSKLKPIYELGKVKLTNNCGIILGLNEQNIIEVTETLKSYRLECNVFSKYIKPIKAEIAEKILKNL